MKWALVLVLLLGASPVWARGSRGDDDSGDLEGRWTRNNYADGEARRAEAYHEIFGDEPSRPVRRRGKRRAKKGAHAAKGAAPAAAASPPPAPPPQ